MTKSLKGLTAPSVVKHGLNVVVREQLLDDDEVVDPLTDGIKTACAYHSEVHGEFTEDLALLDKPGDRKVLEQIELALSATKIEAAMEALDSGDLQAGRQMLQDHADHLLMMSENMGAPALAEASRKLSGRLDEGFAYSSRTRKELHEQKYNQLRRK